MGTLVEKKKEIEDRIVAQVEKMGKAEKLILYAYLNRAERITMVNIDFEIEKALRDIS